MDAFYLSKIGRLVEDQENLIVRQLDEVYVGKTKQVRIVIIKYRHTNLFNRSYSMPAI